MDANQYHANGLSNNNAQYSSLPGISPGISPHQLQQQHTQIPPHTLPPLQGSQHATMQSMYGSAPHTPRTPGTPATPSSANTMGNFPQIGAQSRGYQMMPNQQYQQQAQQQQQQQQQQYRTSASMMPQSSTAMSQPQAIAPAPTQNRMPQQLRPMPPNGLQHMQGMPSPYGQGTMMLQEMDPPTHVVGSQGRRGILPSAPGRPPPPASGSGVKNTMIPAKDADGKFPCPHCTKTYLHAKHLKRHLLRHTGDRPYMCVLCRDTFSRSDILKRHFQKCSIRRGNPTGASHLSHAQAHLKKSHPGPHKATGSMSSASDLMGGGVNGMNNMGNDPNLHPFGVIPDGSVPDASSNLTDEQAEQLSRSNSLKRLNAGNGGDRNNMAGPGPGGAAQRGFAQQNYAGVSTMPTGMNPYMSNGQNGHSYGVQGYDYNPHGSTSNLQSQSNPYQSASAGQQPGVSDWPQHQQQIYSNSQNPYLQHAYQQQQVPIKREPQMKSESSSYLPNNYPGTVAPTSNPSHLPTWDLKNDPIQEVASKLLFFCFPNNQVIGRSNEVRSWLSADNIKHFLENYTNFQGHFPFVHMPTFRIAEAYEGLLLGMLCIGAVYSDRMSPSQVREMMQFSKEVIERSSTILASISRDYSGESNLSPKSELEQLTALHIINVLFTWHGTPVQREVARRYFPTIVALTRKIGLTTPTTTGSFSILHQRHVNNEKLSATSFDWNSWVEQEKRSRLMYAIYLTDAALVLYFNISPLFEPGEIRLPLPTDDAAWDARNAAHCVEALGLQGPAAAQNRNPEGSRRMKQPEMHSALETLLRPDLELQAGTTNLYSKYILVNALHVQLWIAQKQMSKESGSQTPAFPGSGSSTPLMQNDWVRGSVSRAPSATSSGRATPVENGISQHPLKNIFSAFDKWKKVWDEDMSVQYPPSLTSHRRFGVCRDGVHFYWLGKYLMKNNRGSEWQIAPDQRFSQVMHLLKYVRSYVASDSAKRGEELGSVNDIDNDFGVRDLTLDMSHLFKPINKQIDSPVMGVHTGNV